jgi:hypothetical protein
MRYQQQPDLKPFLDGPLYQELLLPFLLAAMTTALLTGGIVFLNQVNGDTPWTYLYPAVFLIALETIYTHRWLHLPEQRLLNKISYRLAEFLVIALVLRLLTWLLLGGLPSLAQWRGYLLAPSSFLDPVYFIFLLFAGVTLFQAGRLADIFQQLALSQNEISYYTMSDHARMMSAHEQPPLTNRAELREQFVQFWLFGGIIVGLLAVLTAFDLAAPGFRGLRTVARLGLQPEMLLALLVYFLTGFWLISHARLAAMRARWLADGVTPQETVARTWRRNSLLLVAAVAFLASLLPIGDTSGLGRIIEAALIPLAHLISVLFSLFLFFFAGLLALLFGRSADPVEETPFPETPIPPSGPPPLGEPLPLSETPALVLGATFWLVMGLITLAAILYFLHDRGYRLNRPAVRRLWRDVRRWLALLWGGLADNVAAVHQTLSTSWRWSRPPVGPPAPLRFIRLNALSPRDKVRYFYLSAARRAREKGVSRAPGETPLEYVRHLQAHWPQAEEDIETLTTAFVAARYGREPIEPEQVSPIQAVWQRVKAALRRD